MNQRINGGDEPAPETPVPPAVYTHRQVDKVIRGALLLTAKKESKPPTVLGALKAEAEDGWSQAQDLFTCLEFGFDLKRRPAWLCKNDGIKYTGVGLDPHAARSVTSSVQVVHCDWRNTFNLNNLWVSRRPPDWVLMVDVLDHVTDPERILKTVGDLYEGESTGYALVVTRNPRFFGSEFKSTETGQPLTLRSRRVMRRLFRDVGFEVIDEMSLPLLEEQRPAEVESDVERKGRANGVAPLHFWTLAMHRTKQAPATAQDLKTWAAQLRKKHEALKALAKPGVASGMPIPAEAPPVPFRFESACILLETVAENIEGVHWRDLNAHQRLLTARNTGGRLFIVKEGHVAAYRGDFGTFNPETAEVVRSVGPGAVLGEMEVFDEASNSDRLYMWSLRAVPTAASGGSPNSSVPTVKALVIPAKNVSSLLQRPELLGNPMFLNLRDKSLEAELKIHIHQSPKDEQPKSKTPKKSGKVGKPSKDERDVLLRFVTRWGLNRPVTLSAVHQIASLFEMALEYDRAWGVIPESDRRLVIFADLPKARAKFLGHDLKKDSSIANAAIQFLEACGVLYPICVHSQLPMEAIKEHSSKLKQAEARTVTTDYFKAVRDEAKRAFKDEGLAARFNEGRPDDANKILDSFLRKSHSYVGAVIESEFLLRRFSMGLGDVLLQEMKVLRDLYSQSKRERSVPTQFERWALANNEKRLEPGDQEVVSGLVRYIGRRLDAGFGKIDSLGMQWPPPNS